MALARNAPHKENTHTDKHMTNTRTAEAKIRVRTERDGLR
jgi:hypothetical protein